VADLDFVHITPTVWDRASRDGAVILSEQTNIALNALRGECPGDENAWGIYLQCDEVFHEEDYEMIVRDIQKANDTGCDVARFRYLHFWQDHHSLAINKKWYPQEIRAVKLNTNIESWGDAQSFRNYTKAYDSDARIYHYGHVREADSYKKKKTDILRLYHTDEKLSKYQRKEKRHDSLTECLLYFGKHPELMRDRIERLGDIWTLEDVPRVDIVGKRENYSEVIIGRVNANEVHFWSSLGDIPKEYRKRAVVTNPNWFQKTFGGRNNTPRMMRSKLARPWPLDFILTLQLSAHGVGLKGK
jgi:hypothetical protein